MSIQSGEFHLSRVSMTVPAGNYGVLMGRTGSGKTTILECILGLRTIRTGTIRLAGEDVTHLNPAMRGVGYVPQDKALFPKMTVRDHLAFALLIRRVSNTAIDERVRDLAESLEISHLLERTPRGLSGGEQQRVALGRALSFRPRVLCLDEPLSALDSETRKQMCCLLEDISRKEQVTTLHVTHNPDEAGQLADCVFQLVDGKIVPLETVLKTR
ncbi:MAG: ATP-binding cassette domain-containing protein [Fuerstiella sp.]|nr:ATP-binding cassette domain-containing protein [Fuerstiella sp.]